MTRWWPRASIYTERPQRFTPSMRNYTRVVRNFFEPLKPSVQVLPTTDVSLEAFAQMELPIHVSDHSIALSSACNRKHYWSHLLGLYPTGKSVHLVAGAAFAAGVEAARRYCFAQASPAGVSLSTLLAAAYDAFHTEWGDYRAPDNPRNAKTYAGTFQALANYLEDYHPGRDALQPLIRPDGTPAVEYKFAVPLPVLHPSGDPFLLVGRFDMLASYNFAGMDLTVPVDEKTASSFTEDWADSWSLSSQMLTYIWALRAQGYNITHAVVRGIAIQKTQFAVRTALVNPTNDLLYRFEQQLLRNVTRMRDAWLALRAGKPLEETHPCAFNKTCNDFGGCAYRTLCEVPDPSAFYSNYILHRWNPTAKQPVEELQS